MFKEKSKRSQVDSSNQQVNKVKKFPPNLYDRHGLRNILGEKKRYLNIGYWKQNPSTIDQACDDLIKLVSNISNLSKSEIILDVGCGFGEQDFLLCEMHPNIQIKAVNSSFFQIQEAQADLKNKKLAGRIDFIQGQAEMLPFSNLQFDNVVCIEAAFHFESRESFLEEAFRVLKPGGRLTLVDFCLSRRKLSKVQQLQLEIGRRAWRIPKANLYSMATYLKIIKNLGFEVVYSESIWKDCYPPFVQKARNRIKDPLLKKRMGVIFRWFLKISFFLRNENKQNWMDYVLISLEKPIKCESIER